MRFENKARQPAFRYFFYSAGIHASIIAFLLALPGYTGNLDNLSFRSLSAFLIAGENPESVGAAMISRAPVIGRNPEERNIEEVETGDEKGSDTQVAEDRESAVPDRPAVEKSDAGTAPPKVGSEEAQLIERPVQGSKARIPKTSKIITQTSNENPERKTGEGTPTAKHEVLDGKQIAKNEVKEPLKSAAFDKEKKSAREETVVEEKKPEPQPPGHATSPVENEQKPAPVTLPEEEKGREPAGREVKGPPIAEPPSSVPAQSAKKIPSKKKVENEAPPAATDQPGKGTKKPLAQNKRGSGKGHGSEGALGRSDSEAAKVTGKQVADKGTTSQIGMGKNTPAATGSQAAVRKHNSDAKPGGGNSGLSLGGKKGQEKGATQTPAGGSAGAGAAKGGLEAAGQPRIGGSGKPGLRETKLSENGKLGLGLPKPATLSVGDIRIEVVLNGEDERLVSMSLLKKPYPVPEKRPQKRKKEDVTYPFEARTEEGPSGLKHVLSVSKAEKGTFTFLINNGGKDCTARIVFHIYEQTPKERIKEYRMLNMRPGAVSRIKFILPDALFWDDEDRFSGEIESSITRTKFQYESGLVWTEDKD